MNWVSVKDRLPEKNGIYEVCYEETDLTERCCGREWFIDGEWFIGGLWDYSPFTDHLEIIYWMPPIQPPKD